MASSIYGVVFASGMNSANLDKMSVVLLAVAIVLIPGMVSKAQRRKVRQLVRNFRQYRQAFLPYT
ncbi:hypothetical protein [Compostibacillus humi]|uniref:hypothetical protein n=1 Tax=Compostibacillus humi TaxID=1245525 RepID=UPI0016689B74|nr:hypothetical protein [Compostibacillus humi]